VRAEEALKASEARYQALYENAPDIYTSINAMGEILSINHTGARMLGYEVEELIGESAAKVIHPEDQRVVFEYVGKHFNNPSDDSGIEYRKIRKDGSVFWVHQRVSLEPDVQEPRLLVICRDVTEKRKLEEQLAHQAAHDSLTNLINRREFERRLQRVLASPSVAAERHVLCFLDLDKFKIINDTCGHIAGDELLRQIATLLEGQMRSRDTLARLGGDEFGVLMEHCTLDQAASFAEKIRVTIENFVFHWRSHHFSLGASIGLVPIQSGSSISDALNLADAACYAAKREGRNRIHIAPANGVVSSGRNGDV
jgi:diguanylate cyclase (GGDEF)-like protein/PAS domain S-box-containing protein